MDVNGKPESAKRPDGDDMRSMTGLLPAILVLNERYFPATPTAPATVGATSFTLNVIECLQSVRVPVGLILYSRQPGLPGPAVQSVIRNNKECVILGFDFTMDDAQVQSVIASAASLLTASCQAAGTPMLYYQTDTLLRFHPHDLPACVTHHAPFLEEFSSNTAAIAFGGPDKALHFMNQQKAGLRELLMRENIFVIQHSRVQGSYLLKKGVSEKRIFPVSPPVVLPAPTGTRLDPAVTGFVEGAQFLLLTAVARLDYFKNVNLLVEAGVCLMERGVDVNVLIIGGGMADEELRRELVSGVPRGCAHRFLVTQRLAKDQLYRLLRLTRTRAVFVCPSRYETFGITPLESALSGVCTVICNSLFVEAARFFPEYLKFDPNVDGLVRLIEGLRLDALAREGERLRRIIGQQLSKASFERDLILTWHTLSCLAAAASR